MRGEFVQVGREVLLSEGGYRSLVFGGSVKSQDGVFFGGGGGIGRVSGAAGVGGGCIGCGRCPVVSVRL